MNFFEKETDNENYKKLLEDTSNYVNDLLIYGENVFNAALKNAERKESDFLILGLLKDVLESLYGIQCLFKGGAIDSTDIFFRNILEEIIYIQYILLDYDLIEEKTYIYNVCEIYDKMDRNKKIIKTIDKNINKCEELKKLEVSKLKDENIRLKDCIEKDPELKNASKKIKKAIKRNKKTYVKWYQIHSNQSSFTGLVRYLELEDIFIYLYNQFSIKTHGSKAKDTFISKDESVIVLDYRLPQKLSLVSQKLDVLKIFISKCCEFISNYYLIEIRDINNEKFKQKSDYINKKLNEFKIKY